MLTVVLAPFLTALAAPLLQRCFPKHAGGLLALVPLAITVYLCTHIPSIRDGETFRASIAWIPALDVQLSFHLDGLSLVFALLIAGIGTLVVLYTGAYLSGHPHLGRFHLAMLLFMGSMLGVVLADNILALFIFWELTSLTSFLLIGFDSGRAEARGAALQALLVTGAGGLALLAGLLLIGHGTGTYELSALVLQGDAIRESPWYLAALTLVLAGAFTKSAQFPFHFWLPNAMQAPTPASAYLHSSTMVKAGIYLMARLSPAFGGTEAWYAALTAAGAATMLVSGYLATRQTQMKPMLAYTTLSALGTLTACIGIGTELAIKAAVTFLVAHAFYKAALFLVAGALDHETGEKDTERLGGLARKMPWTAAGAGLAALSLAGMLPLLGFVAKEVYYEAAWTAPRWSMVVLAAMVGAGVANVLVAAAIGWRPFWSTFRETPKHAHEAPMALWIGPVLLGGLGLVFGLFPGEIATGLLAPAAAAIAGEALPVKLSLWHGITPMLLLSLATLLLGLILFRWRLGWRRATDTLQPLAAVGPEACYEGIHAGMLWVARVQTRCLQHGYLRYYLMTLIAFWILLPGAAMYLRGSVPLPESLIAQLDFHEVGLVLFIAISAGYTMLARTRLAAVTALGAVGYGVALVFVWYGAPDVAMTQIIVETLTIVLFVFVYYRMPPFISYTRGWTRLRDLVLAGCGGTFMMLLAFVAMSVQPDEGISSYFAEHAVPDAHGRNLVNVILVDFRALDTLGEITVLAISALGIYGLLRLRKEEENP